MLWRGVRRLAVVVRRAMRQLQPGSDIPVPRRLLRLAHHRPLVADYLPMANELPFMTVRSSSPPTAPRQRPHYMRYIATEPLLWAGSLALLAVAAGATEQTVLGWAVIGALAGFSLSGSV
jgi:hypothetical protein